MILKEKGLALKSYSN